LKCGLLDTVAPSQSTKAFLEPSAGPEQTIKTRCGLDTVAQVNRPQASSEPSAGPSNKQSKEQSSVASTRSHQVNRAPSLPRNPGPFRTNNQRSRVWPRHGRTKSIEPPSLPRNPVPVLRTNNRNRPVVLAVIDYKNVSETAGIRTNNRSEGWRKC
jgi:hypothetical protein